MRILSVTFIFFMVSCSDELLEINQDPNNPTYVPPINLITQAQYNLYDLLHGRALNAEWGMLMVQHWAQNEYNEESRYVVNANTFDGTFQTFYASILNELNFAKELISADEGLTSGQQANQIAIVDIMFAQAIQALSDGFGDVPLSEALNSIDFPNPKYDTQEQVYTTVLSMLQNAVNSIDESASSFDSGELIYGGDMTKWKKLGSSLLLRAAMRVSNVDGSMAQQYITSSLVSNLISSNEDNALYTFDDNPSIANPLYRDRVNNNRDDFCVSELLVERLKEIGDPRLDAFASKTSAGQYVGMPYGLPDAEAFTLKGVTSRPNDDMVRDERSPHAIMDYANVQFFLAEAYQRGILSGDAQAAYNEGVKASMNYWGITDEAAIDAYISANAYDASNWEASIGEQKWLALYMNGYEAWSEWRRIGYPELEAPEAAVIDQIPTRLPYPISEQTNNNSSLQQVTSTPGNIMANLWWDVD